ncbi:MAG: deoxyribonuclease IV [Chloroflexi bacterium]|nr:deoxyribonuclease IV [Chloroflexota bacterium]
MKIGAHVSTSGGIDQAVDRAREIGAEAVQIFGSGPQSWRFKMPPPEQTAAYKRKAADHNIGPTYLHGIYLINLATQTPGNLPKAVHSLKEYMELAHAVAAKGVIFHIGSHKGAGYDAVLKQVADAMIEVLEATPPDVWLVIENSAGMGQHVGARFSDIGTVIRTIGSPRVKVCLDTEHSWAAGYDVASKDGLNRAMDEFDKEVGVDKLVAVHANDSKGVMGWGVDRHENIGQGHIGVKGFETIMGHPAFKALPFLLEVPGFEHQGPDQQNVGILKDIREKLGLDP